MDMAATGPAGIVVLDGGMGMELTRRSKAEKAVPLWSAQVMMDEPELVTAVHSDFVAAGADVITLNTYSATPRRLLRNGYEDLTDRLQGEAVRLAQAAAAGVERPVRLAGSLPPLEMSYRPERVPSYPVALEEFRRLAALQAPHVSMIIAETMSTISEGVAATAAIVETGCPAWTAFSVDDVEGTRLRSGEPLAAAFAASRAAGAEALLVNCSSPILLKNNVLRRDRSCSQRAPNSPSRCCGKAFGHLAEVLGGGGEGELVFGAVWSSQA
ncbi:MAG: homocysteine S-methyltransferase family protein [Pseudomonadota bacterium]